MKRYVHKVKSMHNKNCVNLENQINFKVFLAILIISGFNRLPVDYWSELLEMGVEVGKHSIRRVTVYLNS